MGPKLISCVLNLKNPQRNELMDFYPTESTNVL